MTSVAFFIAPLLLFKTPITATLFLSLQIPTLPHLILGALPAPFRGAVLGQVLKPA